MNRTDEAAREVLAAAMEQRRIDLRLRWEEIAAMAGISTAHLRKFRRGEGGLGAVATARLEEALEWAPGSLRSIESGLDPLPLQRNATVRPSTVEAKAIVPSGPAPEPRQVAGRTIEDIQTEIAEIMSRMTPEEIARFERDIAEEEEELARVIMQRRLRWARLMRGEPPITD